MRFVVIIVVVVGSGGVIVCVTYVVYLDLI